MSKECDAMSVNGKIFGDTDEFEAFLKLFDNADFRNKVCEASAASNELISNQLDTYFSEMRFGHEFLKKHLPDGNLRVLEVGSGLGLLSIFLKRCGHDAVALEPAALSFDVFAATKKLIWENAGTNMPDLLEIFAEELDPGVHGKFDFIFSINVMEHIADIETATTAILSVLSPNGQCVNSCPNYWIPYEPHYAIPMIPFFPHLTRKVFARRIDVNPELWDTFNFITFGKVRRMAHRNNASVLFEKSMIYDSFKRLGEDTEFMARHERGLVGRLYHILSATRLLYLLKYLPPALSTPMVFSYRLKKNPQT